WQALLELGEPARAVLSDEVLARLLRARESAFPRGAEVTLLALVLELLVGGGALLFSILRRRRCAAERHGQRHETNEGSARGHGRAAIRYAMLHAFGLDVTNAVAIDRERRIAPVR